MILLSRLNGGEFALNPDLIERVDATPDTVITLTDGTKYIVAEGLVELINRVRDYRASVISRASELENTDYSNMPASPHSGDDNVRVLRPLRGL